MPKIIAETAWHHEGDYQFMQNLVRGITNDTKADRKNFISPLTLMNT